MVDTDTAAAIDLLNQLLMPNKGAALGPGEASALTASDRDRLLAEIYAAEFGNHIACVLHCDACGSPFDIDFQLPDLLASLRFPPTDATDTQESILVLEDGRRVRLPRGSDELKLQGMSIAQAEAALLALCMVEGEATVEDKAVLELLDSVAPILDVELEVTCPECNATMQAHFDLQHYLLTTIMQETSTRIVETHLLASTYGWSLHEILGLDRRHRRAYAMAIERDRSIQVGGF
ncbi:hypothetical protein [Dyella humicola]|uniref:hypothetical protein n=1 Tax=Dyella humicola TaxID=2992126 RepID=UPI002255F74B|nr:hypothetical protein [Dyella humicola]